jgi:hypothetical protein
MYSYEEQLRAVELYIKLGKRPIQLLVDRLDFAESGQGCGAGGGTLRQSLQH